MTTHRPRPTSLTDNDDDNDIDVDDRTTKSEIAMIPEIIDLCTPISERELMSHYPIITTVSTQRWEQFPHLRDRLTILPLFPLREQPPPVSDEQGHPLFPNLARKFRPSWTNMGL